MAQFDYTPEQIAQMHSPKDLALQHLAGEFEEVNQQQQGIARNAGKDCWVPLERGFAVSNDGRVNAQVKPGHPIPLWGVASISEEKRKRVTPEDVEARRRKLVARLKVLDDGREWPEGSDMWFATEQVRQASKHAEEQSRRLAELYRRVPNSQTLPTVRPSVVRPVARTRATRTRRLVAAAAASSSRASPSSLADDSEPRPLSTRLVRALRRALGRRR